MSSTVQESMGEFVGRLVPPLTAERLQALFDDLVGMQDGQISDGEPVGRLPLAWVALAEWVGLAVDATGRIVDGPKVQVVGL